MSEFSPQTESDFRFKFIAPGASAATKMIYISPCFAGLINGALNQRTVDDQQFRIVLNARKMRVRRAPTGNSAFGLG